MFNNLDVFAALRLNILKNIHISSNDNSLNWVIDLQIVNIKKNKEQWQNPDLYNHKFSKEYRLFYFVCLQRLLEETFNINLYELSTEDDLFDVVKWDNAYKRNNLSRESFYSDVEKKLTK
jgi:hypothetical protein